MSEEEKKERKRLIEEQEAFREQMRYNADMAYCMDESKAGGEEE